jgi:hypothetical protein
MLVILKIPVVYLCMVVWWAIRSEPRPPEPVATSVRAEPESPAGWRFSRARPSRPGRGPHGTPSRGYRRKVARAELPR